MRHWEPWAWLAFVGAILIVVYELIAVARHQLTLSQMVWRVSARYPIIPFAFGFLMGHFFA